MKKIIALSLLLTTQLSSVNAANFSRGEAGSFSDYTTLKSLVLRGINDEKLADIVVNPALLVHRSILNEVGVPPKIGDFPKVLKDNCAATFKLRDDLNVARREKGFGNVVYKDPEIKITKNPTERSYSYIDLTKPINTAFIQNVGVVKGDLVVKVFELQAFIEYNGPVIENIETKKYDPSGSTLSNLLSRAINGDSMFPIEEIKIARSTCSIESVIEEIEVDKALPTGKLAIKRVFNQYKIKMEAFGQTIEGVTDANGVYSFKMTDDQLMNTPKNDNTLIKISCITCERNDLKMGYILSKLLNQSEFSVDVKSQRAEAEKRKWINLFSPPLLSDQQIHLAAIGYSDLDKTSIKLLEMKERYKNLNSYIVFIEFLEDERKSILEKKSLSHYLNLRNQEELRLATLKNREEQKKINERLRKVYSISKRGFGGASTFIGNKLTTDKVNFRLFDSYINAENFGKCNAIADYMRNFGKHLEGSNEIIFHISLVNAVNLYYGRDVLINYPGSWRVFSHSWGVESNIMLMQPHRYFDNNMGICMELGYKLINLIDL